MQKVALNLPKQPIAEVINNLEVETHAGIGGSVFGLAPGFLDELLDDGLAAELAFVDHCLEIDFDLLEVFRGQEVELELGSPAKMLLLGRGPFLQLLDDILSSHQLLPKFPDLGILHLPCDAQIPPRNRPLLVTIKLRPPRELLAHGAVPIVAPGVCVTPVVL
jgi:hypothetical protein